MLGRLAVRMHHHQHPQRRQTRRVHNSAPIIVPSLADSPLVLMKKNSIPHISFGGQILLVHHRDGAADALKRLMDDGAKEYGIGLDLEWQPNFYTNNTAPAATSLIQLATENVAVIFWMTHLEGIMPEELKRLLMDPSIRKFGFALGKEDSVRLSSEFPGATLEGAIDVANEAKTYGFQRSGLKSMTQSLLGVQLSKAQATANWGALTLAQEQLHYAATDAYLSILLYYKLKAIVASVFDKSIDQGDVFGTDSIKLLAPFAKKAPPVTNASSQQLLTAVGAPPRPTYKCPLKGCDRKFGAESAYNDHVFTSKHGEPTVKVVAPAGAVKPCPGCQKKFDSDDSYIKHILATRHDLPDQDPNALPWLPDVSTTYTGHRTIKFVNGTSVTRELATKPLLLSQDDFQRRKNRIDAFSKRNDHFSSQPASAAAAIAPPVVSAPAPAPVAAKSSTIAPEATKTITIELTVYNKLVQDIENLKRQLVAEKKRTADLRAKLAASGSIGTDSQTEQTTETSSSSPVTSPAGVKLPKARFSSQTSRNQPRFRAKKPNAEPSKQQGN